MRPHAPLTLLVLGALLLAGCSGDGGKKTAEQAADFDELDLKATDTTGVIRGVVVDDAVRPVADAVAAVLVGDQSKTTTSAADGAFGFDGLEPGTYFISVSKDGYVASQTSTEVVAGVAEPPIVKVLLVADPLTRPRAELFHLDGFIQCSIRPMVMGQQCGLTNDDVVHQENPLSGNTTYIQSEMIWRSTQAAGAELSLAIRCLPNADPLELCSDGQRTIVRAEGNSPQIAMINKTLIDQWGLVADGNPITIDLFAFGRSDLDFYDENTVDPAQEPVTGDPCLYWPAYFPPGTCLRATGPGFILNQKVDVYTSAFYGYLPPEGWTFIESSALPEPPL